MMRILFSLGMLTIIIPCVACITRITRFIGSVEKPINDVLLSCLENTIALEKTIKKIEIMVNSFDKVTLVETQKLMVETKDLVCRLKTTTTGVNSVIDTIEFVPLRKTVRWAKDKTKASIFRCFHPKTKHDGAVEQALVVIEVPTTSVIEEHAGKTTTTTTTTVVSAELVE
jgi:hypothetical protein